MQLKDAVNNYLEKFTFVEPGPSALNVLKTAKRRTFNMSDIPWIDNVCAWCEKNPVRSKRAKYCSEQCIDSAVIYCNPQSLLSKGYRFVVLQECACKMCGELFEDEVLEAIVKQHNVHQQMVKLGFYKNLAERLSYASVMFNNGFKFQLDHIKPIFKGGATIDPSNLQVICEPCHRRKTAEEKCVKF